MAQDGEQVKALSCHCVSWQVRKRACIIRTEQKWTDVALRGAPSPCFVGNFRAADSFQTRSLCGSRCMHSKERALLVSDGAPPMFRGKLPSRRFIPDKESAWVQMHAQTEQQESALLVSNPLAADGHGQVLSAYTCTARSHEQAFTETSPEHDLDQSSTRLSACTCT